VSTNPPDAALVCESNAVCPSGTCPKFCHSGANGADASASLQVCSFSSPPTSAEQVDSCPQGYVCVYPYLGASVPYCYRLCTEAGTNASDCPQVACSSRLLNEPLNKNTTVLACDPPYQNCTDPSSPCCDPTASPGGDTGCPDPQENCYLVAPPNPPSSGSVTLCDYASGQSSQQCNSSTDCYPGETCVVGAGGGAGLCHVVCAMGGGGDAGCPCTKLTNSANQQYGYCL